MDDHKLLNGSAANVEQNSNAIQDGAMMRAFQLASMISLPMSLKVVLNLGVMDVLAEAEKDAVNSAVVLSALEIAARIPGLADNKQRTGRALERLLRLLGSHGVIYEEINADCGTRKYGLNPVGRGLTGASASFAAFMLMMHHRVFLDTWQHLEESVIDGGDPFAKAHGGMDLFSRVRLHEPDFDALYNSAMANHSRMVVGAFLDSPFAARVFGETKSLVDVGGGLGSCLEMIVARFPHISPAVNFDQPHVVQAAPTLRGIEHVGGDMFLSIPSTNTIFMKWILHDFTDAHCLKILQNCYKALPKLGTVIVFDTIIPTQVENSLCEQLVYQLDMLMFAYCPGGKERTEEELKSLILEVGFSHLEVICKVNEFSVIQIYKC